MYDHVLVGTDGSPTATRAVEAAALLARIHDAGLSIVHAFDPTEPDLHLDPSIEADLGWSIASSGARADALVNAAVHRARTSAGGGLRVEGLIRPGRPVEVMVALAAELRVDAVVVGNADVHRVRIRRSIGHALVRRIRGDVIIVDTTAAKDSSTGRRSAA